MEWPNKELVKQNSEARLRAISWKDWATLSRLSRVAFPETTKRQLSRMFSNSSNIIVLEVDGAAAGYCYMYQRTLVECWLDWLVVDPRCRNSGYGSLLLKTAECIALARGRKAIQLAVLRDNPGAIRFYSRHGFMQYGEDNHKLHMQKSLDSVMFHLPAWLPADSPNRLLRLWHQLLFWVVVRNI